MVELPGFVFLVQLTRLDENLVRRSVGIAEWPARYGNGIRRRSGVDSLFARNVRQRARARGGQAETHSGRRRQLIDRQAAVHAPCAGEFDRHWDDLATVFP
jgi:hypothetical protein